MRCKTIILMRATLEGRYQQTTIQWGRMHIQMKTESTGNTNHQLAPQKMCLHTEGRSRDQKQLDICNVAI